MNKDVTYRLGSWAASAAASDIPEDVRYEGVRSFVNWLGCAVGGAREPAVERAIAALGQFSSNAGTAVLGRAERFDAMTTALINGISSHVLDYDDTHLKTIIHPAGPVASAALGVAETTGATGDEFLTAFILGIEAECRIGNAVYPDHYDRGYHITATAGAFGAAVAVGRLLGLDAEQMTWALGISATQSSGLREVFGTMTKSFNPGRAAQNGLTAAFLAKSGFDSSRQGIEGVRGFANVLSDRQDYGEIVNDLGGRWEAKLNSYKPFACGIVIHPTIDACQQLRRELGAKVGSIASVSIDAHPLTLELTGKREPSTGLETKFSIFHSAAVALLRGDGSPTAFTDEAANDPALVALRRKVDVRVDPACHEAAATVTLTLADGSTVVRHVERAIGSRERPLTDDDLVEKFRNQSNPVLGSARVDRLLDLAWSVGNLDSVARLCQLAQAERAAELA